MRILGIDPGSQKLGWGIIDIDQRDKIISVEHGTIVAEKGPFLSRLAMISSEIMQLCAKAQADVAVIEKLFLGKNADSAFKLGHVRGVCIVESQRQGAEIIEYTPREVKKAICGSGSADKYTVQRLLYAQLGIVDNHGQNFDASDALAMAYCYCLRWQLESKMQRGRGLQIDR